MKFMEGASIFLIIGGVLLGPIMKHPTEKTPEQGSGVVEKYRACLKAAGEPIGIIGKHNRHCLSLYWGPYETTAETCARAMREIGATLDTVFTMSDMQYPSGHLHEQPVLCIPAPSGLKP